MFRWWGPEGSVALWEVEVAGQRIDERDKTVVSEARLLCPVDVPAGLRARDLTRQRTLRLGRKALGLTPAMDRLVKAGVPGAWEMVTQA